MVNILDYGYWLGKQDYYDHYSIDGHGVSYNDL